MSTEHARIYIQFADNGNIRKWQREPFDGGAEYVAASPSSEAAGWRPIETAPKDGTKIILLLSTGAGNMVHIGCKDQRPNSGWHIEPNGYWSSVTHWMPLPAAPVSHGGAE